MTQMYLFVEGMDDIRFFESVTVPIFEELYDGVHLISYAWMKAEKIGVFIKTIISMGDEYLFIADIDISDNTGAKKTYIIHKIPELDPERIVIVVREIEGWYLAGVSDEDCKRFSIPPLKHTNQLIKEQFDTMVPEEFDSRIDFLIELLRIFRTDVATGKNRSFRYFFQKYIDTERISDVS